MLIPPPRITTEPKKVSKMLFLLEDLPKQIA